MVEGEQDLPGASFWGLLMKLSWSFPFLEFENTFLQAQIDPFCSSGQAQAFVPPQEDEDLEEDSFHGRILMMPSS